MTSDQSLHNVLVVIFMLLLVGALVAVVYRVSKRTRPGLNIGVLLGAALVIRMLAASGVSLLNLAQSLRGGDETTFLYYGRAVAARPFSDPLWADNLVNNFHQAVFAFQIKVLDSPDLALRALEIGMAVMAIALIAIAVYDLAGARAAWLTAAILTIEPANVFFSGLIHKESFMYLAEAMVAFGGVRLWTRQSLASLIPMGIGCLIALAVRPYAGFFLVGGMAAIVLHASRRVGQRSTLRGVALFASFVLLATVTLPFALYATSSSELNKLQSSQSYSTSGQDKSNLKLEAVDYSTPGGIVSSLPRRIRDVLVRPYPWQLGNSSQRLGLLDTLLVIPALVLLAGLVWRGRGVLLARAGPFVYVGGFTLVSYALSAGNAGTAFRYRTHVIMFLIPTLVVLRELTRADARELRTRPQAEGPRLERVAAAPVAEPVA